MPIVAAQRVVSGAAFQPIAPAAALECIGTVQTEQGVPGAGAGQRVGCRRARQRVGQRIGAGSCVRAGAGKQTGVAATKHPTGPDIVQRQRAGLGGVHVDHRGADAQGGPDLGGFDVDLRGAAQHGKGRNIDAVDPGGEIGDHDVARGRGQHEGIGALASGQPSATRSRGEEIVARARIDRALGAARHDHIVARGAKDRAARRALAFDHRAKPLHVDDKLGDARGPRPGARDQDLRRIAARQHLDRGDVFQPHAGVMSQCHAVHQLAAGHQGKQAEPVVGAARHHEDLVVHIEHAQRRDAGKPRIERVEQLCGGDKIALGCQLGHGQGRTAGMARDHPGAAEGAHRVNDRGSGHAKAVVAADLILGAQGAGLADHAIAVQPLLVGGHDKPRLACTHHVEPGIRVEREGIRGATQPGRACHLALGIGAPATQLAGGVVDAVKPGGAARQPGRSGNGHIRRCIDAGGAYGLEAAISAQAQPGQLPRHPGAKAKPARPAQRQRADGAKIGVRKRIVKRVDQLCRAFARRQAPGRDSAAAPGGGIEHGTARRLGDGQPAQIGVQPVVARQRAPNPPDVHAP